MMMLTDRERDLLTSMHQAAKGLAYYLASLPEPKPWAVVRALSELDYHLDKHPRTPPAERVQEMCAEIDAEIMGELQRATDADDMNRDWQQIDGGDA